MTTKRGSETDVRVDEHSVDDKIDITDYDAEIENAGDAGRSDEAQADDYASHKHQSPKWLRTKRNLAFAVMPALALILAVGSGYLKWQIDSAREDHTAGVQAVQAATENTIAILSYQPDNAAEQLTAARVRLAEPFKDQYTKLITDVVVPGAEQKKISAIATVPAAATMSATANRAVVLVFIDQSIVIGTDAPTTTSSTVRVTLDKDGDRWLISQFDPV